jgi:ABC-2 type transport system permease protein
VKKYVEFAQIFFKSQIVYRFDVIMTCTETIGRVLFAWLIWGAVFAGRDEVGGFVFQSMLMYYIVSSFIGTLEIGFGVSGEIAHEIRNGTFSKFMVIPVNPLLYWLAQNLGVVSFLAMFVLPVSVVCGFLFGAGGFVGQSGAVILGIIMIPLGLTFMVTYHFFIGILAFKFQDISMFRYIQGSIILFAQGGMIPLSLLPETVLNLLRLIPFPHVVFTPAMLIIGKMDLNEGLFSLGVLVSWLVGMIVLSQTMYKRLRIKYDGVGI